MSKAADKVHAGATPCGRPKLQADADTVRPSQTLTSKQGLKAPAASPPSTPRGSARTGTVTAAGSGLKGVQPKRSPVSVLSTPSSGWGASAATTATEQEQQQAEEREACSGHSTSLQLEDVKGILEEHSAACPQLNWQGLEARLQQALASPCVSSMPVSSQKATLHLMMSLLVATSKEPAALQPDTRKDDKQLDSIADGKGKTRRPVLAALGMSWVSLMLAVAALACSAWAMLLLLETGMVPMSV